MDFLTVRATSAEAITETKIARPFCNGRNYELWGANTDSSRYECAICKPTIVVYRRGVADDDVSN
eukprot:9125909-Lingulodinium_polyedra.AAC.1